ncbi:putative late blight resistance protein homolog R1B-14 isoform X1 [Rhododendron vialii]|uniref:putative late blight resistance protein homolog R1B-14 isoform X1 n=1 Tax=Rhododendron vialii TaxID=182163 RepID=UPI00265DA1A2|nr:putative late blight resistance protein homolog R1B-14 isoform X1 [Rhododendron vialii]
MSSEDKLGEDTHKCLKGKKYLIVMDDIWGIEAWNDIQRSLPRECNGSKVLFTSRLLVEPNSIHCVPHCLAPLPKSCSWELLQKKVFGKKCCPPELVGIGEHIAEKCKGLPLAIVAIAGILAVEDKTLDVWEGVSKRLSSIIGKNQDGCMKILELSYNHLPLHLKACFIYIGGFPEDSEILVRELIWLWIAEGFIQQSEGDKSLEDVAKDYLSSLIDRSLIMVARKRSLGGIKSCRIHDLLRELCLKKAEEDNFLVQIYGDDTFSPSAAKHHRLFIGCQFFREVSLRPCTRNLRSFLCLNLQNSNHLPFETNLRFFVKNFELLRVLCFISTECRGYIGRGDLIHLRYLALQLPKDTSDFASPFSYLFNLETLILRAQWTHSYWKTIPLPRDIFKMVKLRHLYAKRGAFTYHLSCRFTDLEVGIGLEYPSSKLDSLQTLHPICPCNECRNFLVRTPNLRKLGVCGDLISDDFVLMLPDLEFLKCLETLSFTHCGFRNGAITTLSPVLKFPPTVTRLTLENTSLKWEELSILQTLPSLEVLKLSTWACRGQIWNTSELEEGFSQLKYLRLHGLEIEEWNASEDQFPSLEVLVVKYCSNLKRIPIDFANLNVLREIEVVLSSRFAEESAKEIQEERRNTRGDDDCINLLASSNY